MAVADASRFRIVALQRRNYCFRSTAASQHRPFPAVRGTHYLNIGVGLRMRKDMVVGDEY